MDPFQILVGPNGSGKSAFMDALAFLGTLVSEGLHAAVNERTDNFYDLVWGRQRSRFGLAIEAKIREGSQATGEPQAETALRYEVRIRLDAGTDVPVVEEESLRVASPGSDLRSGLQVIHRRQDIVYFTPRDPQAPPGIRLSQFHTALGSFPEPERVPAVAWLRELLDKQIQFVKLDVSALRKPSPPQSGPLRRFSGSNLARVVNQLYENSSGNFDGWLAHVRTTLPDLEALRPVLRPEARDRYLMARYANGIEVPSWNLSEGTLRLLALTVLAYLGDPARIYLIEEPENGVHPAALETIYQSLSSIYEGQVFLATHSPMLLALAKPEELLCFRRTDQGTEIVRGSEHPALRDWKGEVNLAEYFAAGVLD